MNGQCTFADIERCFRSLPEVADFTVTSPVPGELVLRITWTGTNHAAEQTIRATARDCLAAGMIWAAHVTTADNVMLILPESPKYQAWIDAWKDFKSTPDDHVEPLSYSLANMAERNLGGRWWGDYQQLELQNHPLGSGRWWGDYQQLELQNRPLASYNSEADYVLLSDNIPLWQKLPPPSPPPLPYLKRFGFKCRNLQCPDRAPKLIQETCYTCAQPMEKIS